MKTTLTCIECPLGCVIEVEELDGKIAKVDGYSCLRGKAYAENEVICPKRVVTTTVKTVNGKLVPVKTDNPVNKSDIFIVMDKINKITVVTPVKIGDIIARNLVEGVNLIATDEAL